MDESTQQLVSIIIVAAVVGIFAFSRWRNRKRSSSCGGCGPQNSGNEVPIKFMPKRDSRN
jgi:hypothetical protein